jgi:hypothetical protein
MLGVCLNHGAPSAFTAWRACCLARRRGQALQPRSGAPKARGLTATSGAKLSYNQAVVAP